MSNLPLIIEMTAPRPEQLRGNGWKSGGSFETPVAALSGGQSSDWHARTLAANLTSSSTTNRHPDSMPPVVHESQN